MTRTGRGFAAQLRDATTRDHEQAETSTFMADLLEGRLDLGAYRQLVVQHLEVYRALEAGAAALRDHPEVSPFHDPALERVSALRADLAWLRAHDRHREEHVLAAARRYAERITEVAADWPGGFVAHHYTRYLGDLSGGLHIGRLLARRFAGGTDFYRFPGIANPKRFKDGYRAALDTAPWDADERARIVEEVSRTYALNQAVFAELQARTSIVLSAWGGME